MLDFADLKKEEERTKYNARGKRKRKDPEG